MTKFTVNSIVAISCLSIASLFVTSCNSTKTPVENKSTGVEALNLPSWVINPKVEGKVAAVGIAPASKGGLKVQIAQAETDARANIAQQISTEVSRITKDSLQKANVDNNEAYQAAFTQATKEVVKNIPLTGAIRNNFYKDPATGDLYIQMVLDQEAVSQYLQNSIDTFSKSLASAGATQKTIQATQAAMKPLFDELNEETKKTSQQ